MVFASDNGGSYAHGGDAGDLRSEKGFYYDGGLRAPAFIRFGENTVRVSTGDHVSPMPGKWSSLPAKLR